MSRIHQAFENKKAFIAFIAGGDPDLETTEKLIPAMEAAGADLIEIGIPFSDPIAEGVVIQEANIRALSAGCTTDKLFDSVKRAREKVTVPMVFLTYPLPKIVLLPLFLTLFGLGDLPRVLLIALTTGYQILVVTRASAQGLDKKYLDSFRSLGGTPLQMLRHVLIPAALPDAMTALKVASGTAVAVLFMAESFATRRGLGFLIMDAWGRGDQLEMFTGILAMSLLGVALYELCNVLETRSCRWRNFHMAGKR